MMREMQKQKEELDRLNNTRRNFANSGAQNGDTDETLSEEFLTGPIGTSMVEAMKEAPVTNSDGDLGYILDFPIDSNGDGIIGEGDSIEERFQTRAQIDSLLNDNQFDVDTRDALLAQLDQAIEDAKSDTINPSQIENNVRQNVIEQGKWETLVNRELIQGRTFKNDLICAMDPACKEVPGGLTYEQLGITQDMLVTVDDQLDSINLSDGITSDEAKILTEELLKDKQKGKHYLTKYYTNFITQNFPSFDDKQQSAVGGWMFPDVLQSSSSAAPQSKTINEGGVNWELFERPKDTPTHPYETTGGR